MTKKEAVPNRQYTAEFKQEAVRLAASIGGNATAKRLGVPQSTVTNWLRRSRDGALQDPQREGVTVRRPVSELEAEVSRLRRELAGTRLDLEIVKHCPRGQPRPHMNRNRRCVHYGSLDRGPLLFGGVCLSTVSAFDGPIFTIDDGPSTMMTAALSPRSRSRIRTTDRGSTGMDRCEPT